MTAIRLYIWWENEIIHHGQCGDVILKQLRGKNVLHALQLFNLWCPPALPKCLRHGTKLIPAPGIMIYGWPSTQILLQKEIKLRQKNLTLCEGLEANVSSSYIIRLKRLVTSTLFIFFLSHTFLCSPPLCNLLTESHLTRLHISQSFI